MITTISLFSLLPRFLLLILLFVIVMNLALRGKEEHFALEVMSLQLSGLSIMVITLQLWSVSVVSNIQS